MKGLVCMSCGYRFESDKKKNCPYCNSGNVDKEKSAEELLNEIEIE